MLVFPQTLGFSFLEEVIPFSSFKNRKGGGLWVSDNDRRQLTMPKDQNNFNNIQLATVFKLFGS